MREDSITLTQQDSLRLRVLEQVATGRWTAAEAAAALGLTERQVYRLKAKHESAGAAGIVHGNRGRQAANRITAEERDQIVALARGTYADCNQRHLRDLLAERHGILVSSKSVGRLLREAGLAPVRRRRAPRHRLKRDRMPQEGMLLQVDGSDHAWFGKEHPRTTLLGAIDDATGKVVAAVFREQEDAHGYLLLLRAIVSQHGTPLELYHDRHSIFVQNQKREWQWTVGEGLQGQADLTQFGRSLVELGIGSIPANSPQAKGRIERLWGTWQDRLVVELRLAGITTIAAANTFLPGFIARHDARFAVPAQDPGLAYQPLLPGTDLDRVLSFRYERVVARDNTVQLDRRVYQIPAGQWQRSYAGARVDVHQLLDGGIGIWYQGAWLLRTPPSAHPPTLRALRGSRKPTTARLAQPPAPEQITLPTPKPARKSQTPKPGPDHPWRRQSLSTRKPLTESLSR